MSNTDERNYVNFRAGIKHPKLSWLVALLNKYGVAHRMQNTLQGQMLQVEKGTVELACEILNQELGRFTARVLNDDDAPTMDITVTIDDLPNDHEFFAMQTQTKDGSLVISVPAKVTPELVAEIGETLEEIFPDPVVEDDEEDEDEEDDSFWGFTDEDEDEDESVPEPSVGMVIDVEAKVIEDEPNFLDTMKDEAQAEFAKSKKPKKEKPVPSEPVDPDFETAVASESNENDFLEAEQVLPFEETQFPDTRDTIRMFDVDSSTLSAFGMRAMNKDPLLSTVYVRFKSGGTLYRYNPVPVKDANLILSTIIRRYKGVQEESPGSVFHYTIKVKGEEGTINVQRLDGERWVVVLPKSERTKALKNK